LERGNRSISHCFIRLYVNSWGKENLNKSIIIRSGVKLLRIFVCFYPKKYEEFDF